MAMNLGGLTTGSEEAHAYPVMRDVSERYDSFRVGHLVAGEKRKIYYLLSKSTKSNVEIEKKSQKKQKNNDIFK